MASSNRLAGDGHKGDIPTQADIAVFLKSLGNHDTVARAAKISSSTYIKWHRKAATKMSAVHLLQVVLRLDAVPQFTAWLATYGGTFHNATQEPARGRLDTIPTPFVMPKVGGRKSATGRKGRGRQRQAGTRDR